MSQLDRIAGTLLGLAAGDALGAGYEFGPGPKDPQMVGGGSFGWAPGEWTDDTQMAICIAEETATGTLDPTAVGDRFLGWLAGGPTDVGISTRAVLSAASSGADLAEAAADYLAAHPNGGAGNGSLMRTAPVALAHLGDDAAIAADARAVSDLTHGDPRAGDACVLWCIAIDRAVREQRLDGIHDGLALLPADRRDAWAATIADAEVRPPGAFVPNGFVVTALQAAHAAVTQTPVPAGVDACRHLTEALRTAVRIGGDTDTVAAIAGALLGARWGASALPFAWRRLLHGWPGYRAPDLVRLAVLTAKHGRLDHSGWPTASSLLGHYQHTDAAAPFWATIPGDEGLLAGNVHALPEVAGEVDAVVSLCRMGRDDVPAGVEHDEIWLVDKAGSDDNPNLECVLDDAADAVATLRGEGRRVFLHCVGGHSRTPTVAALYLARTQGISGQEAIEKVAQVLDYSPHNGAFRAVIRGVEGTGRNGAVGR